MEAKPVRKALSAFASSIDSLDQAVTSASMSPETIRMCYGRDPYRVVLALNPLTLHADASRINGHWHIRVVGTVPVEYPQRARVSIPLPTGDCLEVDEALFWVLQETGWLHPYSAEWSWGVRASDLRRTCRPDAVLLMLRFPMREPVARNVDNLNADVGFPGKEVSDLERVLLEGTPEERNRVICFT